MSTSVLDVVVRSQGAVSGLRSVENGIQSVQREINRASSEVKRFESSASSSFKSVAGVIAGIAGTLGLASLTSSVMDNIKSFEQLRAVLNTVEGSTEKAQKSFAQITEFTKQTPFELDDVTKSFIILRRTGMDPSMKAMETFGNVAAANGKKFNQFAEAIADAATGEFERLKEFGIKMSKQNDSITATFNNQTKVIKADTASIVSYLYEIGETRYADGIAQQSTLMQTALSNINDAFASFSDAIGRGGLSDAIRDVASEFANFISENEDTALSIGQTLGNAVRSTAQFVKELYNNFDKLLPIFSGLVAYKMSSMFLTLSSSILTAVTSVKALTVALLANPIGLVATAIGVVVGLVTKWYVEQVRLTNATASTWDILSATASVLRERLEPAIQFVIKAWEGFKDVLGKVGGWTKDSINFIIASFVTLKDFVVYTVDSIYTGFKNTFGRIAEIASSFGKSLANLISSPMSGGDAFAPLFETLNKEWTTGIPKLAEDFRKKVEENFATDTLGNIGAAMSNSMSGFMDDVNKKLVDMGDKSKNSGNAIADGVKPAGTALEELGISAKNAGDDIAKLEADREKFNKKLQEHVKTLEEEIATIGLSKRAADDLTNAREAERLKVSDSTKALIERVRVLNQEAATATVANNIKDMVGELKRETAELSLNNTERAAAVNIRQAENAAKSEGTALTQSQIDAIRNATIEYENQKDAMDKRKDAEQKVLKVAEDAEQKRRQEIEKTAQAYENASQRMGSAIAQFIYDSEKGFQQLVGAAISAITAVLSAMNGGGGITGAFFQGLGNGFGGFRADGGGVSSGKTYVVGEKGPELFTTNQSGVIIPNDRLNMMSNSSKSAGITIGSISVSSTGQIDDNFINDMAEAIVMGANKANRKISR